MWFGLKGGKIHYVTMGDTEVPAKKRLNVVKNCLLLIEKVRDLMKLSPKTRQVDRRKENGEDEGNDVHRLHDLFFIGMWVSPTWSWINVWRCMRPVCSHGTSRWRLKSLCLTTTTPPPTESLTPSPSLIPSKTLTNFLCNLTWHTGYPFLYFYIFVLLVHIRGSQTSCFQNTTTVSDT